MRRWQHKRCVLSGTEGLLGWVQCSGLLCVGSGASAAGQPERRQDLHNEGLETGTRTAPQPSIGGQGGRLNPALQTLFSWRHRLHMAGKAFWDLLLTD